MNDRTLPGLLRLILIVPAIGQTVFALTLLTDPSVIGDVWPWPMTPISARILGASTLVSVPLAVFAAVVNRWSAARIPIVMLLTYRVFQLAAGLWHIDRFDFSQLPTWNYFAGGAALMVVYTYALLRGNSLGSPVSDPPRFLPTGIPLALGSPAQLALRVLGALFIALGVAFLILGPDAAPLWFEADGELTPLTARLFASPMIGLALALWLVSRATWWSEIAIPASGMITFGISGGLALLIEWDGVDPPSAFGYFSAAIPLILLIVGIGLIAPVWLRRTVPEPSR